MNVPKNIFRQYDIRGLVDRELTPALAAAYDQLKRTHDAIHAWRAREGRRFAGTSWEIYGDWSDDPSKLETTVCYLLG